jgi:hypothetical protein
VGLVVDVGAGKGVFAVPVARLFPRRRMLCVEPALERFMHLCANLVLNRLDRAYPQRARVAEVRAAEPMDCPDVRLDHLVPSGRERVALVRIATSAGQLQILEGGAALLQTRRPLLLLARPPEPDPGEQAVDAWLAHRGYGLMQFSQNRLAWHCDDPAAGDLERALRPLAQGAR